MDVSQASKLASEVNAERDEESNRTSQDKEGRESRQRKIGMQVGACDTSLRRDGNATATVTADVIGSNSAA